LNRVDYPAATGENGPGKLRGKIMKTHSTKPNEITREWWLIDADGVVLGRLASEVAKLLRGKNKPIYSPHMDVGDHVIVVNASKVLVTGNKFFQKRYYRHSGYPGGLRSKTYEQFMIDHPEKAIEKAVKGMLPRNRLGRAMLKKLRVYVDAEHPHSPQSPKSLDIRKIAAPHDPAQAHTLGEVTHIG
jgi:large subunit ribosomal protein L13